MKRFSGCDKVSASAAGGEIGVSLVRQSPLLSWIGDFRAPLSLPRAVVPRSMVSRVLFTESSMPAAHRRILMDILYTNCAGLDIHKDTVVACSRRVTAGKVIREVRTFKTTTSDLLALSDWLASLGATHMAMEATPERGRRGRSPRLRAQAPLSVLPSREGDRYSRGHAGFALPPHSLEQAAEILLEGDAPGEMLREHAVKGIAVAPSVSFCSVLGGGKSCLRNCRSQCTFHTPHRNDCTGSCCHHSDYRRNGNA